MSFILDQLKKSGKKRELELAMRSKAGTRITEAAGTSRTDFQPMSGTGIHLRGVYLLLFAATVSFFILGGFMLSRGKYASRQEAVVAREAQVHAAVPSGPKAGSFSPKSVLPVDKGTSMPPGFPSRTEPEKAVSARAAVNKIPDKEVKTSIRSGAVAEILNQPGAAATQKEVAAPPPQEKSGPQDAARRTPYLNELAASLQKELPPVRITSHLYRGNSRLVSINGRIMSEGVSMDGGLFLEEITPEGAVLSFRGHRFRVRAD